MPGFHIAVTLSLLGLLLGTLLSCSDIDKSQVSEVMDARDQAISSRNIAEYSALISNNYNDRGRNKVEMVAQMVSLFAKFRQAEMSSYDRQIRKADDAVAQCEQSYRLRVFADGDWREIVQREQLTLVEEPSGWKIISGL